MPMLDFPPHFILRFVLFLSAYKPEEKVLLILIDLSATLKVFSTKEQSEKSTREWI